MKGVIHIVLMLLNLEMDRATGDVVKEELLEINEGV
jgi:hypothetical protein